MKDYTTLTIEQLHEAYLNNEVTPFEVVSQVLEKVEKDTNNAFEYICKGRALNQAKNLKEEDKGNLLWGIPYVLKDNYSTKDIPTTASSNILEGYVPIYSSEVFLRLENEGAILIGKATLDELAMGGTGTSGHLGKTYNPYDPTHERMIGGSSCGSAASVSAPYVPFSIGSDTGDSVRKPASYSGLVGFKPTWGRISRYGLFPFAPSLDHVGYFTRSVKDAASLLNVLAGYDEKDATSSSKPVPDYTKGLDGNIKGYKIAVIDEILNSISNQQVIDQFNKTLEILEKEGASVTHISMDIDLVKAIYPTYVIISCCEATSNDANLDGIKFGLREGGKTYEEVMTNTRTKGFSTLIKRRFVIGGYSLLKENQQELFLRAQKARHLIVDAFNKIYQDYDLIYLPASPSIAPKFSDASDTLSDQYLISDNYLAFANFGGYPSLTLPIGFIEGMPYGGNISGRIFEEDKVFNVSLALEKNLPYFNLSAKKETK